VKNKTILRENRWEVKLLRAEVERLRSELEAKFVELQIIGDAEDLDNRGELGHLIATNMELRARV
jgi:hypothetical protein